MQYNTAQYWRYSTILAEKIISNSGKFTEMVYSEFLVTMVIGILIIHTQGIGNYRDTLILAVRMGNHSHSSLPILNLLSLLPHFPTPMANALPPKNCFTKVKCIWKLPSTRFSLESLWWVQDNLPMCYPRAGTKDLLSVFTNLLMITPSLILQPTTQKIMQILWAELLVIPHKTRNWGNLLTLWI